MRGRLKAWRRAASVTLASALVALLASSCGPRGLSCESYNEVYQEQLDKYAYYAGIVASLEAANVSRNNPEYISKLKDRELLWDSAEEVAANAASQECYVDKSRLYLE